MYLRIERVSQWTREVIRGSKSCRATGSAPAASRSATGSTRTCAAYTPVPSYICNAFVWTFLGYFSGGACTHQWLPICNTYMHMLLMLVGDMVRSIKANLVVHDH